MEANSYCIGVDFGTDSVRSIIVNTANGQEVASSVFHYPRWRDGLYCNPVANEFRQHPLDYLEGLEQTVRRCLIQAGPAVQANVKAISVDTTGSTPTAVDESGTPLALLPAFEHNPNAMFILWKDHSAVKEAAEINHTALSFQPNYLKYVGGIYSSEWFWAKLLHVLREDESVQKACYSWVEHCDWIPFLLTGGKRANDMKRGVCTAGHKALWAEEFGGLPPDEFFAAVDPRLKGFRNRLFNKVYTANESAGYLSEAWAERLHLTTKVRVGIGAMDAHMGAVGGQIEPFYLSKVMGTSTCDMLVVPKELMGNNLVKGICGQVDGSVIPGMIGLEAGQSAFGDTYAWFKNLLCWPLQHMLAQSDLLTVEDGLQLTAEINDRLLEEMGRQAALLPIDEHIESEFAVDWFNGRRTPDANQNLKGAITGLSLGSDPPRIYRALIESTCFGARAITDRFQQESIELKGIIGIGGIAKKSPYVMQTLANVLKMPIKIHSTEQTCAAGAAMFAATVAGIYPTVTHAMEAMGQGFGQVYTPESRYQAYYDRRYEHYQKACSFLDSVK